MGDKGLLDVRFMSHDLGREVSIREYFRELLARLWAEKECFSGKRPFGNSDWDSELYRALVKEGVISGKLDEDGWLEEVNSVAGDEVIARLIAKAFEREA